MQVPTPGSTFKISLPFDILTIVFEAVRQAMFEEFYTPIVDNMNAGLDARAVFPSLLAPELHDCLDIPKDLLFPGSYFRMKSTFINFSQVSKLWNDVAIPFIYRHIMLGKNSFFERNSFIILTSSS
jgi:hypothetical protein